jgi:hypothetical protein
MASSSSDNFRKMFEPEHPHRKLHIFVSALAVVVIVGYVVFTFIIKVPEQVVAPPIIEDPNVLTQIQRNQIVTNLQELVSKSPPLIDSQRNQIISNLKKTIVNQNK